MDDRRYDMDSRFAPMDVRCLFGEMHSGRTSALIEHARARVASGERVLFVCTSDPAFERAYAALSTSDAGRDMPCGLVRVCRPADVALDVLATPQARAMFGRSPRILAEYEQDILMEDMKVSQMRNRRLRALSGYLFSGWENLFDDRWEQTYEEDLFIERLRSNLRFIGGVLPCEASNLALKVLREHEDVRRALSCDWVIVDDFELASRASQHMLRALARTGFLVASAVLPGPAATGESCPCYRGAAELVEAVPSAVVSVLPAAGRPPELASAIARLGRDEDLPTLMPDGMAAGVGAAGLAGDSGAAVGTTANACGQEAGFADRGEGSPRVASAEAESGSGVPDESFAVSMGKSPEEEMLAMARTAADAISSGESVLIVGSSALWRRNVAMNFARVGLEVDEVAKGRLKGKNLENPKVAGRIERVALERLARDPADGVSWRALLAVGDHVARSAAVDKLRAAVSERADGSDAVRLLDALEMLRAGEFDVADIDRPIMDDLLAAYARARDLLKGAGGGSRESRFAGLSASDGVSSCASGGLDEGGISLCSLDDVAGRSADVVILGGFVNGAVPCRAYFDPAGLAGHARERERARCVRGLYGAAGAARSRLVVTGFTQANLQIAETMDLHIASIKLKDGVRTAILEPSAFLDLLQKG